MEDGGACVALCRKVEGNDVGEDAKVDDMEEVEVKAKSDRVVIGGSRKQRESWWGCGEGGVTAEV